MLSPDESNRRWIKRYVELRPPYLHIYAVPEGDEINTANLTHARIDARPSFERLLHRPHVWAVYAEQNTLLFSARTEVDKSEWIFRVDSGLTGAAP